MRYMSTYQEAQFRHSVEKALEKVKTILDTTRHPRLAHQDEEQHSYDDKFALAEFLVNTAIAAKMNALERLGLTSEKLQQVSKWVHEDKQSLTLRLQAEDYCTFVKDRMVEVSSSNSPSVERQYETTTTTTGGSFLGMGSTTQKVETVKTSVTTKIKEHHWKVGLRYRLVVFKGTNPDDPESMVELQSRSASTILITSGGSGSGRPTHPIPERTMHQPIDVNLTWFFERISPTEQACQFVIERNTVKANRTCKTPRRNQDVDGAVEFDRSLYDFARRTVNFFVDRVEADIANKHNPAIPTTTAAAAASSPNAAEKDSKLLPLGSIVKISGLQKEPTFNGKEVKVVEYLPDQQRYRVDPVDPKDGLPPTLLIKPYNLDATATKGPPPSSSTSSTPQNAPPLNTLDHSAIFVPVLPLMEGGSILSGADVAEFLAEQIRSMDEAMDNLAKSYPPRQLMKLVSVAEASIVLICQHLLRLTQQCHEGLDYIEDMLKQQLVHAIGKEVATKDFEQFMRFRAQKVFGTDYAPRPFSYAIRRPKHFPDGMLSIETTTPSPLPTTASSDADKNNEPIDTWARRITDGPPMSMPINAATSVELGGDRCLHGWLQHRFKSRSRPSYQLVARARQFSSFLLILGTIGGPDRFEPKDAIILQNKDQVLIPLLTNTLPTAKEFKDAIVSLSPEQQEFAKAFRAMQLESSVFAVCVIQLKPQLERLLGLPDGSLTKEIQLTQDLMSLFIEYQIPSDLLAYEGDNESSSAADKVTAVKGYVKAVLDVIDAEKKRQLEEEVAKADMRAEMMFAPTGGFALPDHHSVEPPHALDESERSAASGDSSKQQRRRLSPRKKMAMAAPRAPPPPRSMAAMSAPVSDSNSERRSARKLMDGSSRSGRQKSRLALQPAPFRSESIQAAAKDATTSDGSTAVIDGSEDFTAIPKILDSKVESFDTDNALRSTIIKANQQWTRFRQENLLMPGKSSSLDASSIETEKKKAFDLLDAISRSGTLPIDCAELHVVIGLSHCFENDVMGTVIQDNINPIAKVEKSALLLASTIYSKPAASLLAGEAEVERLTGAFPELLGSSSSDSVEIYQD